MGSKSNRSRRYPEEFKRDARSRWSGPRGYRTRIEWFDREEQYARFEADRANGEEVYNLDLQRFLFLEGDHITHAKPRSASGEADLIGDLDGRDPLVCDGKIFDGKGRGKGVLVKGLHQVVKYAHDYGQHTAYLVIYNISDKILELPTDGTPGAWPPYTELFGGPRLLHPRPRPATPHHRQQGRQSHPASPSPETTPPTPTPPDARRVLFGRIHASAIR
ncbi:hypothetical protein [Streptomyces flavidovirens]